jgi:hypothetical protein
MLCCRAYYGIISSRIAGQDRRARYWRYIWWFIGGTQQFDQGQANVGKLVCAVDVGLSTAFIHRPILKENEVSTIDETISADWAKVEAFVVSAADQIGAEAKTILTSVGGSALTQALALAKETAVGTAVANSVSAVQASGGNLATALPTIVANTTTAIAALDKTGSVFSGLESELSTFATALVSAVIDDFKGNAIASPLITLFSAII